jgi:hypothetical protein
MGFLTQLQFGSAWDGWVVGMVRRSWDVFCTVHVLGYVVALLSLMFTVIQNSRFSYPIFTWVMKSQF